MTKTHGRSGTRIYQVWAQMKSRCSNPKAHNFHDYGARGIKVCQRWETFENFHKDMGDPQKGLQLDRINNLGDYEPSNCRWASRKTQMNNRRGNVVLELDGKRLTMSEWADSIGISKQSLWRRLELKWPLRKALSR